MSVSLIRSLFHFGYLGYRLMTRADGEKQTEPNTEEATAYIHDTLSNPVSCLQRMRLYFTAGI